MSADADYLAVLADLKKRREDLDAAIVAVESIIASLNLSTTPTKVRGAESVPPDAFLSLTIPEAAIKYLGMVRSSQSVAQIWEALKRGGLPHTKYAAVYNALTRREDLAGDIIKLEDSNWGLAVWYPRRPSPTRRKKRDKELREGVPSEASTGSSGDIEPPTEKRLSIGNVVEQMLREAGEPLRATEIVRRLEANHDRVTTIKSLTGTLPQDKRKRFRNLGNNIWTLAEPTEK